MKFGSVVAAVVGLAVLVGPGERSVGVSPVHVARAPSVRMPQGPGPARDMPKRPARPPAAPAGCRRAGLPALFVENRGQFDPRVEFAVWKGATRAYLTRAGLVLPLRGPPARAGAAPAGDAGPEFLAGTIALTFEGASPQTRSSGEDEALARFNYFLGNDPAGWITQVPTYKSVRYQDLYPGIDAVFHEVDGVLEYDLCLEPGACLGDVVLGIEGAQALRIDDTGSLIIVTPVGLVVQPRPTTFTVGATGRREAVACAYEVVDASRVRFRAPDWDGKSRLVIDPGLIFSTFVGGSVNEIGYAVAIDSDDSAVVSGSTESADFPTTPGAFDTQKSWVTDGTVLRLSPDGATLVFATFLGGAGSSDEPRYLGLISGGNIVVAGKTSSPDFPTTPGAFDTTLDGIADIFVTKLTPDGASLIFSTLIGGPCADSPVGMALDSRDRIYFGEFESPLGGCPGGYPTTPNAICGTPASLGDVNVTRLSADGSTLEFSSFLCSGLGQSLRDLTCDDVGHAYIIGDTQSMGMTPTPGAFDTTFNGDQDFYVARVDCDIGHLDWCTYLGGNSTELYGDIAVDMTGDVYVTGKTYSSSFPTVPGSFDTLINGGADAFVAKLSGDGSSLIYSTFLGGLNTDEGHGITVDADGHAYVTGWVSSSNFPVSPDAFQSDFKGKTDTFLCKFSADGAKLLYSTFLGGSQPPVNAFTWSYDVAIGLDDLAAVTGYTAATDYPTTPGAFDMHLDGFSDAFVACFDLSPWTNLGQGLAGTGAVVPALTGAGSLQPGSTGVLTVQGALPATTCALVVGLENLSVPFKGGTFVPEPLLLVALGTDGNGAVALPWLAWPAGIPAGTKVYLQAWVKDSGAVKGWSASNGLLAWTPVIEN